MQVFKWFYIRSVITSSIIVLLALLAIELFDSLDHLVSLVGSVFGIPLAFIIPSMMQNCYGDDAGVTKYRKVVNNCVIVFGFFAMCLAGYATLSTWNK